MKIFYGILYYTLQWTFGILQNLIGFFMWLWIRLFGREDRHGRFRYAAVTGWKNGGSMAMGMFIFVSRHIPLKDLENEQPGTYEEHILSHEYGHTVQSAVLGPLYLPVIGLPSIVWCNFPPAAKRWKSGRKEYESFYPEKWATRLGLRTEARHRKPGVLTTGEKDGVSV